MDLVLTPPEPVPPVPVEKASRMMPVSPQRDAELAERARAFAGELAAIDPRSPDFTTKVAGITAMGATEIGSSSQVSNRMLKRPLRASEGARSRATWCRCAARSSTSTRSRPPPAAA